MAAGWEVGLEEEGQGLRVCVREGECQGLGEGGLGAWERPQCPGLGDAETRMVSSW